VESLAHFVDTLGGRRTRKMEKKLVTTYSVNFRGKFGRNRSVKYTSRNPFVEDLGDLVTVVK
jgi:hypothetical protein